MRNWRRTNGWTRNQVAAAYRLIQTPMGRDAAAEGWICALWDFCREHSRLPTAYEADKVRAASLEVWTSLPPLALAAAKAKAVRLAKVALEQGV